MDPRAIVQQHDKDGDGALNFTEFCEFKTAQRPDLEYSRDDLQRLFQDMDEDHNGIVSVREVLRAALFESLSQLHTRAIDLFKSWDEDHSGTVSKKEFRKAMRALGFMSATEPDLNAVFDELKNKQGVLEYKDLSILLKEANKRKLREPKVQRRSSSKGAIPPPKADEAATAAAAARAAEAAEANARQRAEADEREARRQEAEAAAAAAEEARRQSAHEEAMKVAAEAEARLQRAEAAEAEARRLAEAAEAEAEVRRLAEVAEAEAAEARRRAEVEQAEAMARQRAELEETERKRKEELEARLAAKEEEMQMRIEETVTRMRQQEIAEQVEAAERAAQLLELAKKDAEEAKEQARLDAAQRREDALWAAREVAKKESESKQAQHEEERKAYWTQLEVAHRAAAEQQYKQLLEEEMRAELRTRWRREQLAAYERSALDAWRARWPNLPPPPSPPLPPALASSPYANARHEAAWRQSLHNLAQPQDNVQQQLWQQQQQTWRHEEAWREAWRAAWPHEPPPPDMHPMPPPFMHSPHLPCPPSLPSDLAAHSPLPPHPSPHPPPSLHPRSTAASALFPAAAVTAAAPGPSEPSLQKSDSPPTAEVQTPDEESQAATKVAVPRHPFPTNSEQRLQQLIDVADEAAARYTAVRASASQALARSGWSQTYPSGWMPPSVSQSGASLASRRGLPELPRPSPLPMEQAVIARRLDLQTPRGDVATALPLHSRPPPRVGEDSVAAAAPQASVDRFERLYGDAFASLEADRQRHVIASADLTRRLSGSPKHR